jgi:hypothetical protein
MVAIECLGHLPSCVARRRACPRVPARPEMHPSRTRDDALASARSADGSQLRKGSRSSRRTAPTGRWWVRPMPRYLKTRGLRRSRAARSRSSFDSPGQHNANGVSHRHHRSSKPREREPVNSRSPNRFRRSREGVTQAQNRTPKPSRACRHNHRGNTSETPRVPARDSRLPVWRQKLSICRTLLEAL